MGRLQFRTGNTSQVPGQETSTANGRKLDMVLEAVECIGTMVNQTSASLESKTDKVTSDLHADHRKLADKRRLLEDTLSDLIPKASQMDALLRDLTSRVEVGA
ncbi:hypothetical protein NDU88_007367 [Pleurodeles waltl]|uniref:Uncharacterized protein n=1 Tax=Pleurodeles waltl TaxID=8319 RepID=A0AAV7URP8_PLEWA|nr:hypothetical protein NDU88_007367 [Pleurodeles waltl]